MLIYGYGEIEIVEIVVVYRGGGIRPRRIRFKIKSHRSKAATEFINELKEQILKTGIVRNTHKPYHPVYNKRYKVSERQAARVAYSIAKSKGLRVGKYRGPNRK